MKLSILILTLPSRRKTFLDDLLNNLEAQASSYPEVEILVFYDNKKRTVGQKRDGVLSLAKGDYMAFIDDDDSVAEDYIKSIIDCLNQNPETDCVVFDTICTIDGGGERHCKYGTEYEYCDRNADGYWTGKPAHTMVYKRELVQNLSFGDAQVGEDFHWVSQAWPLITHQSRIDKVLYYYKYNSNTTETRR